MKDLTKEKNGPTDLVPPGNRRHTNLFLQMLYDGQLYDQTKRFAGVLAKSQFIPRHFQGKPEDCFIGCLLAARLEMDPISVLQNCYIAHGTPGISAKFGIALTRQKKIFGGPIQYDIHGEGDTLSVCAHTTMADSAGVQQPVSASASMAMAKAEGWTKPGKNKFTGEVIPSKYETMGEHMLCFRAATFLIRRYAPEVLMGMQTVEELEDQSAAGITYDQPISTSLDEIVETLDKNDLVDKDTPTPLIQPATTPEAESNVPRETASFDAAQTSPEDESSQSSEWPQDRITDNGEEIRVDSRGVIFNYSVHTGSVIKTGVWRRKKGLSDQYLRDQEIYFPAKPEATNKKQEIYINPWKMGWEKIVAAIMAAADEVTINELADQVNDETCPENIRIQARKAAEMRRKDLGLPENHPF